jgi:hypothetical protein
MKNKGLIFVSCLATAALIASPAMGKPAKKSSMVKSQQMAPQTKQMGHHNQKMNTRMSNARYVTGSSAGRQHTGTRYYGGKRYYSNGNYYAGSPYYYGNGWGYGSSSVWPYVAASVAPYVVSSWGARGYGYGYPYSGYNNSYYGGYPYGTYNNYSYYTPRYSYNGSTVAAVQQRLGRLGYYHGTVDGVIGPQTRGAIAAFERRNGLAVDGTISGSLLNSLGLS